VLAHSGGRRLYVLNELASWIWGAWNAGLSADEMAAAIAEHSRRPLATAQAEVEGLMEQWRRSGLLDPSSVTIDDEPLPRLPPAPARPNSMAWGCRLGLADQRLELGINDPRLAAALAPAVDHLRLEDQAAPTARVALTGHRSAWTLYRDSIARAAGTGADEAISRTIAELVETACQGSRRLLVVHGAGIVQRGAATLLIGRGGSGKTTLAAALNAAGWPLLGDDVVPITAAGMALSIGMSLCLKAGSWSVLAARVPALHSIKVVERAGEPVRFVPPPGAIAAGPLPVAALLFPTYRPGRPAERERLGPAVALQRLIAAEPYLPPLTQTRLEALMAWMEAAPAYAFAYPDLEQGLAGVGWAMSNAASATRSSAR
jgi:hypothetical protein